MGTVQTAGNWFERKAKVNLSCKVRRATGVGVATDGKRKGVAAIEGIVYLLKVDPGRRKVRRDLTFAPTTVT